MDPNGEYAVTWIPRLFPAGRSRAGADLIGNVAGGRPIKRRGRGVGAVARHWRCCRSGVLDEHTAWSELLFPLRYRRALGQRALSMVWLCTLRALLPRPLRNWKLVKATAQLPASASQHNTTTQISRHTRTVSADRVGGLSGFRAHMEEQTI